MPRALRVCNRPGCHTLTTTGRCSDCKTAAEQRRGTARQRGYDRQHETRFRAEVLKADPLCVCITLRHGHGAACLRPSVAADHHPRGRDELVRLGLDPNDPRYGRGLCQSCHSKVTADKQPGGWNTAFLAAAAEANGLRDAFDQLNRQDPRG